MQNDEQGAPGGKVEEAGDIAFQGHRPSLGHQEQREKDREQRVEQHGKHDVEQWHPFHRVAGNRAIGPFGLNVGARLRIDIDIPGTGCRRHGMHRLAHSIDGERLLEDVGRTGRYASEVLVGHGQVGKEFRLGKRRGLVGIELPPEYRPHAVDEARPLAIERAISFAAGDDVRDYLARTRIAREEALRPRLAAGRNGRPDVAALGQFLHRVAAQQHIVEDALAEMLVEVGREFRIGDAQRARRVIEPRAVDHAVLRIVEIARQAEHHLGRSGEIVAHLTGKACHQRKAERDIADSGWREAGIEAVGDAHIKPRHHQA